MSVRERSLVVDDQQVPEVAACAHTGADRDLDLATGRAHEHCLRVENLDQMPAACPAEATGGPAWCLSVFPEPTRTTISSLISSVTVKVPSLVKVWTV